MVEVVAALIMRGDKFLICQRPANKARGLKWEFAGGKVEAGETPQDALKRECREELNIELEVGEKYMEVTHKYPDIKVHLTLFRAVISCGEPELKEHAALKWITAEEAADYTFCAADAPILKALRADSRPKGDNLRKKKLGKKGESLTAKAYKKAGYKILERNFITPFCEVDIIAKRGDVLVFCEVKTRLTDRFGTPSDAVTHKKRQHYIDAAKYYVKGEEVFVRFDVAEVYRGKVNIIESAFTQ